MSEDRVQDMPDITMAAASTHAAMAAKPSHSRPPPVFFTAFFFPKTGIVD